MTQRLCVDGDHFAVEGWTNSPYPSHETIQERRGIDGGKDPIEGVVRRDAVGAFEKRLEPWLLGLSEHVHVLEAFPAGELRAQADDENVPKLVQAPAVDARAGHFLEVAGPGLWSDRFFRDFIHDGSPPVEVDKSI